MTKKKRKPQMASRAAESKKREKRALQIQQQMDRIEATIALVLENQEIIMKLLKKSSPTRKRKPKAKNIDAKIDAQGATIGEMADEIIKQAVQNA